MIGLAVLAAIEGNHERTALLTAPITAMTPPPLGILLRHDRDRRGSDAIDDPLVVRFGSHQSRGRPVDEPLVVRFGR